MVAVLAMSCVCVTCCSSMAGFTYPGMEATFHVGTEVCTLSISLFVMGLGTGPRKLTTGNIARYIATLLTLTSQCFWDRFRSSWAARPCCGMGFCGSFC
jgi:hypothetical protein